MLASELHRAAESMLRKWLTARRINKTDVGDDDPRVGSALNAPSGDCVSSRLTGRLKLTKCLTPLAQPIYRPRVQQPRGRNWEV
jgi:hypothetical protein